MTVLQALLLVLLSLLSSGGVWWLLRKPYRPTRHPVDAPEVAAYAADYTLDIRGLT